MSANRMIYERIEECNLRDIEQVVFKKETSLEEKVVKIYSAIYFLDVEEVAAFLIKIFQIEDKDLNLATAGMLEAFMQSRATNHGFQQFIEEINRLKSKYPQHACELADVEETLGEFNAVFS